MTPSLRYNAISPYQINKERKQRVNAVFLYKYINAAVLFYP